MAEVRLLIVEDDELFAEAVAARLGEGTGQTVIPQSATSLDAARAAVARQVPDAILLDPNLPDCDRLEGIDALREAAPDTPVVVLTGRDSDELGVEAVQRGAQAYLVKARAERHEIAKALRHAVERQRVVSALEGAVARLRGNAGPQSAEGAQRVPLKESATELFDQLSGGYGALLQRSPEPGAAGEADPSLELGRRLHEAGAGPRDIVDAHLAGMAALPVAGARGGAAAAEAQVTLLELIGRTLSFYRDDALGEIGDGG